MLVFKPPYSIVIGELRLAIWDASFWTFLLKFGQRVHKKYHLG